MRPIVRPGGYLVIDSPHREVAALLVAQREQLLPAVAAPDGRRVVAELLQGAEPVALAVDGRPRRLAIELAVFGARVQSRITPSMTTLLK